MALRMGVVEIQVINPDNPLHPYWKAMLGSCNVSRELRRLVSQGYVRIQSRVYVGYGGPSHRVTVTFPQEE